MIRDKKIKVRVQSTATKADTLAKQSQKVVCVVPREVGRSIYVDDLAIYFTTKIVYVATCIQQKSINKIETWGVSRGLTFEGNKTIPMLSS